MSKKVNSPTETPPSDETEESNSTAPLTRRDALVAAASASVLSEVNNQRVTAQTSGISVGLSNLGNSVKKYEQFNDAEITELKVGSETEVTVDIGGTTDSRLQLQGYFSINGGNKSQFASQIQNITNQTGQVVFENQPGDSLWLTNPADKPSGVTIDSTTDFDVEWLPIIDSNYANLRPPQTITNTPEDLAEKTECAVTFEALSNTADIQETQTIEFDLHVGYPFGLGESFTQGFATNKPPQWPSDWDSPEYS